MSARALSCYFISWPYLMVLWVPRQLYLSVSLEASSTRWDPTHCPSSDGPIHSLRKPPVQPAPKRKSLETKQAST